MIENNDVLFVADKIGELVRLAHDIAPYDSSYSYLLDIADRMLCGCREAIRVHTNEQKVA